MVLVLGRRPVKRFKDVKQFVDALYDLTVSEFDYRLPKCVEEDLFNPEYSRVLDLKTKSWKTWQEIEGVYV